jgi:putative DNA primase/helicase
MSDENDMKNLLNLASEMSKRQGGLSEDALALHFVTGHCDRLRYVAAWGRWFQWIGSVWQQDNTLHVFDLIRDACREALGGRKLDASTVNAVEKLSRSDRRVAATVDQWDTDIWLLNTPAGSVDLRTGRLGPHQREDYCTKLTAVAPSGGCPLWLAFLKRITADDADLQLFLQRWAGYSLTGSIEEHAMVFGHGDGANGKGVFVNSIQGVMGDYATTAPMETFIASHNDRHPTELAGLRGARLVTAQETEQGRRWAESKIKALTGGDKIAARFMRQDFFEFIPQFKLLIVGNHKPGLRRVDEAIRRRMNLVPFTVTIPEAERDEKLLEKLKAEWPGILQWMLDGCAMWQGEGLAQPEAVRKATDDYLADEDAMAQWMAERCILKSTRYSLLKDLFADWTKWADAAGEEPGSQKQFSRTLQSRDDLQKRLEPGTKRAGFDGIGLQPQYSQEEPPWPNS